LIERSSVLGLFLRFQLRAPMPIAVPTPTVVQITAPANGARGEVAAI
jgi:hypothetical protein